MNPGSTDTTFQRLRRSPFLSRLRVRLTVLVLCALAPPSGLIVYTAFEQRHQGIARAREDALRLARTAANMHDQHLESARQLLFTLAQLDVVQRHEREPCTAIFSNLVSQYPLYTNLGGIRPDGSIFASALAFEPDVNLGDREYFRAATNSRAFAVGEYQIGRVTKSATLNVGHAVLDEQRRLAGVVYAALDLSWLRQLVTNAALPPKSSLTAFDRKGMTLVRYPDPRGEFVGQPIFSPARWDSNRLQRLAARLTNQPMELARVGKGRDGIQRLYASTMLGHAAPKPIGVTVGIPVKEAYAAANRALRRNLIFLALATAAAMAAAWLAANFFVLRRVRSLVKVTRELTHGDLAARTGEVAGTGELHELARSFDQMAGALQQREEERDRAQRELRQLNEQLEQRVAQRTLELKRSNDDLEQFAYVASHDLQEPLRMVTSYLQLLQTRYQERLDADAREFIAYAREGAERMQALTRGLLEYSRISTRGRAFEPVDCEKVLSDVLANLKVAMDDSRATVTHAPLPTVKADPVQLTQVLQNLIGNAIKFRRDQPPVIHVAATRKGPDWQFSVRDNGLGIEPRDFDRIFVIFQRLHTREKFPGTGLGLAFCKKIVERHGGRIWLESTPGQGTTFYFTLPVRL